MRLNVFTDYGCRIACSSIRKELHQVTFSYSTFLIRKQVSRVKLQWQRQKDSVFKTAKQGTISGPVLYYGEVDKENQVKENAVKSPYEVPPHTLPRHCSSLFVIVRHCSPLFVIVRLCSS